MHDHHTDPVRRDHQELRNELDRLRLENQSLRIELERLTGLRPLVRRMLRLGWDEVRDSVRKIRQGITGSSKKVHNTPSPAGSPRPYQVRALYPPQPRRRKVLHAIGNFWTGGSARLVVDLIEHLGHKYEQEVITRDMPQAPGYTGVKVRQYERLTSPRPVLALLRKYQPGLLHVHYLAHHRNSYSELDWKWYNNVFLAAKEYGCRIIENINIPVDPYISEAVNCYVYVSAHVEREFGRDGDRNVVVYPGSDLRLFSRRPEDLVPDDCIGMVYRLEKDKLSHDSINPLIEVVRRRRKTKVLIVGGGRYYEPFRDAAARAGVAGAFTFTGYVAYDDLPALYSKMSIFVAPVHSESFGQVAPFAMGMGIPVVGYDVGALGEIVQCEELLAPPGDMTRLADIIIGLLEDRERRLRIGAANRRRAQDLFSVETMVRRYEELYAE